MDHLGQNSIQQFKFSGGHPNPVHIRLWVLLQKQVGVIDNLSELHHRVSKRLITNLTRLWVKCESAVLCNAVVHHLLPGAELDFEDEL